MKNFIVFINKIKRLILNDTSIIEEVSSINIHRIYILALVMIPVHLAHILIFSLYTTGGEDSAHKWRIGIIIAHSVMLIIVLIVGAIAYRIKQQKRVADKSANIIQAVASLSYLIFGVLVCSIDQLVTANINPYLMACTGVAVVLLIRPALAVINYAIAYTLLYCTVSLTQQNVELLLSVRVNGITATGIGFGVALLLWRNNSLTIRQKRQIQDQNRKLEEKNTQIGDFLAIMSHEIRTPMNGIVGMTDLLLQTRLNDEQREYAATAREASELLIVLINDILDLSKIEDGKMDLEIVSFKLPSMERSILAMVEPKARYKGLVLRSSLDPVIPNILRGDPVRLRQVLLNLLSNSVKFTDKGEISLRAIPEGGGVDHITVRFEVQDTGIGIADEARRNLFQPFIQADPSTTRKYGGTGLGLSICKRLVELMNGQIGCESKEGRGSTFWFTVPFSLGNEARDLVDAESFIPEHPSLPEWRNNPGTILVAEDFAINKKIILTQLKKLGLATEVVSNGREAIEAFLRNSYALILMDCQMPVMNGFEAVRAIRNIESALGRRTPIIATTASAMAGDREKCLKAGMDDCIFKPIRMNDLQKVLLRWLPYLDVPLEVRAETSLALEQKGLGNWRATAAGESPGDQKKVVGEKGAAKHDPNPAPDEPETVIGSETIVIVGDDQTGSKVLISALTRDGYNVLAVFEKEKLLDILAQNSGIGLVVLDLNVQDMSGYEICRKIRQKYSMAELPVLILTARTGLEEMKAGFSAGANDFLANYDPGELAARVRTLVQLRLSVQAVVKTEKAFSQAQIKPHFIFNALNTVSFFCETEPALAAKLLDEFSNYLRGSFDFPNLNDFVELEHEISLVKSYLALENARFGEKLKVVFHLDESAYSKRVPPLILLPIVENAVKHGILPREKGGTLTIRVTLENDQLIMSVEDDGLGMNPGAAASVLLMEGPRGNGTSLRRIQKKIGALYGRSIRINSEKGRGTCVTIIIPGSGGDEDDTGNYRG